MNSTVKKILYGTLDLLLVPFSFFFLPFLKLIRRLGVEYFPLHRRAFKSIGVFPIHNHYYEPQIRYSKHFDAKLKRPIPLDFNIPSQLQSLQSLLHTEEIKSLTGKYNSDHTFYLDNGSFGPGDADLYYLLIRNTQPKKIIEIGSGFSTLLALKAIAKNTEEGFRTELTCIEPYEKRWLEELAGVTIIRERVEKVDPSLFHSLQNNDILFIDSSHIIRPENDVLFIYMQLLPSLNKGVRIHIHDIFSPRHYRADWLTKMYRFWNEQYLLEAFLYNNSAFTILYSLNYLKNDFYAEIRHTLMHIAADDEPSSFWQQKTDKKL